jgi:hypothetical protein
MIHAASLKTSARLQRVHSLLRKGAEFSTRDIIQRANVCAVNTIAAELKACGVPINCRRDGKIYFYSIQQEQ